jgi:hypothetical protein
MFDVFTEHSACSLCLSPGDQMLLNLTYRGGWSVSTKKGGLKRGKRDMSFNKLEHLIRV